MEKSSSNSKPSAQDLLGLGQSSNAEMGNPRLSGHKATAKDSRPLLDSELREFYVRGLIRNLLSVFSSIYQEEVQSRFPSIHPENRAKLQRNSERGDTNFDLISYLLSTQRLGMIVSRFTRTLKNEKQGTASFHHLALAHCLLCVLQHIEFGKHERHSMLITSSMAMGRVIDPLSKLTRLVFQKYSLGEFNHMSDQQIKVAFPKESQNLDSEFASAQQVNRKSTRLPDMMLTKHSLIRGFALIRLAGLESFQPFELFLKGVKE